MNDPQKAVRKTADTPLSRRKFVTLIAAGSAALLAQPLASLAATKRKGAGHAAAAAHAKPGAATPAASKNEKEFQRQRASTLDTLKVIRAHKLPAGTEPAFVFRVMKPSHKERG